MEVLWGLYTIWDNPLKMCLWRFSGLHLGQSPAGVFMEVFWGFYTIWDNDAKTLRFYGSPDTKVDVSTYDDVVSHACRGFSLHPVTYSM